MFKRCLLASIILHIFVIAGVGISIHQAPPEFRAGADKIDYFQLVTDIYAKEDSRVGRSFKTANSQEFHWAVSQPPSGSTRVNPSVQGSPAPGTGKTETEINQEDLKPEDLGLSQTGANLETNPEGSFHPGIVSNAGKSDGTGIPGNDISMIPPRRVYSPNPVYPTIAKRNNWQGLVILRALIKPDGAIGEITIYQSSGFEILDRSALQTVKKWRYQPALRQGEAVECYLRIPVRFQLEE